MILFYFILNILINIKIYNFFQRQLSKQVPFEWVLVPVYRNHNNSLTIIQIVVSQLFLSFDTSDPKIVSSLTHKFPSLFMHILGFYFHFSPCYYLQLGSKTIHYYYLDYICIRIILYDFV